MRVCVPFQTDTSFLQGLPICLPRPNGLLCYGTKILISRATVFTRMVDFTVRREFKIQNSIAHNDLRNKVGEGPIIWSKHEGKTHYVRLNKGRLELKLLLKIF